MIRAAADDVAGEIIGDVMHPAALYYQGRKQGRTIWGGCDGDIRKQASILRQALIEDNPHAYPCKDWELRFFY